MSQRFAVVAVLIPLHARLGVIAVGRDLHIGPRPVLVKRADAADELLCGTVAPQFQFVLDHPVHPEFGPFPAAHAFGPHIAQQPVRQEAKLVWLILPHFHVDDL